MLKEIPLGSTFIIRLVEPLKNGFNSLGPRTDPRKNKKGGYGSGKETIRFRADGKAAIEEKVFEYNHCYSINSLETYCIEYVKQFAISCLN